MKLSEITERSVGSISDKELLNLHYRLHQQYTLAKKRDNLDTVKSIRNTHKIVVKEMARRAKKHKSPMLLRALKELIGE